MINPSFSNSAYIIDKGVGGLPIISIAPYQKTFSPPPR